MVRAFRRRKEQTGQLQIPVLVVHQRFQDDVVHDYRSNEHRGRAGGKISSADHLLIVVGVHPVETHRLAMKGLAIVRIFGYLDLTA